MKKQNLFRFLIIGSSVATILLGLVAIIVFKTNFVPTIPFLPVSSMDGTIVRVFSTGSPQFDLFNFNQKSLLRLQARSGMIILNSYLADWPAEWPKTVPPQNLIDTIGIGNDLTVNYQQIHILGLINQNRVTSVTRTVNGKDWVQLYGTVIAANKDTLKVRVSGTDVIFDLTHNGDYGFAFKYKEASVTAVTKDSVSYSVKSRPVPDFSQVKTGDNIELFFIKNNGDEVIVSALYVL